MNRNPYNVSRPGSSGSVGGVEGAIDPIRPPSSNPPSMSMNSEDEDSDGRGKKVFRVHRTYNPECANTPNKGNFSNWSSTP